MSRSQGPFDRASLVEFVCQIVVVVEIMKSHLNGGKMTDAIPSREMRSDHKLEPQKSHHVWLLHPRPPSSARQQRQEPGVTINKSLSWNTHVDVTKTEEFLRHVQPGLQRAGIQDLCLPNPIICLHGHRLGPSHCTQYQRSRRDGTTACW